MDTQALLQALQSQADEDALLSMLVPAPKANPGDIAKMKLDSMRQGQRADQWRNAPVSRLGPLAGASNFFNNRQADSAQQSALETLQKAMDAQSGVDSYQAQMKALQERIAQAREFEQQKGLETHKAGLKDNTPDDIRKIEWLLNQPPEIQKRALETGILGGGGVTINTGDQGLPETLTTGLANQGYMWDGEKLTPIPGGPADRDAQKEKKAAETVATRADNTLDNIAHAKSMISPLSAGWGGVLADVPESDARALRAALKPIQASLAFDRLQQMRNESTTGGALGQVSNIELDLLQSSVVNLDQLNKPEELERALDKAALHYSAFTDALDGKVPATYQQAEINGEKYIKVEGQWYPL